MDPCRKLSYINQNKKREQDIRTLSIRAHVSALRFYHHAWAVTAVTQFSQIDATYTWNTRITQMYTSGGMQKSGLN
jgi:hypothetical protein